MITINTASLRKTFLDLVKIPSPSYHERAVADYVMRAVKKIGLKITEDQTGKKIGGNCGNLIVTMPATKKTKYPALLLTAHLDTVEDGAQPIKPMIAKEIIRSAGDSIVGADDKCGVAILLEMMRVIKKEKIAHGDLVIVFSVAEEKGASGVDYLSPKIYQKLAGGIVLDSATPLDKIVISAPTKIDINITVHGIGGHAGAPENKINAAQVLAKTVSRLPLNRLDEHTTANLGVLWSGTAVNIIPELAYAEYEIRSHKTDLLDVHLATILTTIESAVREARVISHNNREPHKPAVNKATVDVDIITAFVGYKLPANILPAKLLESALTQSGFKPQRITSQGGSDANTYNARGLPTVVFGCGMHEPHSSREYANLNEMNDCAQILLDVVQTALA